MTTYKLSEAFSVTSQVQAADIESFAAEGYKAIICNRPNGEEFGQPAADTISAACAKHGIAFHYLPIGRAGIPPEMIDDFRRIVADSDGPVLAYCRSGQRSAVLWQTAGSP